MCVRPHLRALIIDSAAQAAPRRRAAPLAFLADRPWQRPGRDRRIVVAGITAGGAARLICLPCAARRGPGTTIRSARARPTASGATRATGSTASAFVWCARPHLTGPSRQGACGRRGGCGGFAMRARRISRIVRRPRFAGRGEEGKMARARPVRTARRRRAVGRTPERGPYSMPMHSQTVSIWPGSSWCPGHRGFPMPP